LGKEKGGALAGRVRPKLRALGVEAINPADDPKVRDDADDSDMDAKVEVAGMQNEMAVNPGGATDVPTVNVRNAKVAADMRVERAFG
jgi:hypothetical protein